ncbi:MAG: acetolactate decarboxylase [Defluviicoccus sp.]|nr:MAG: acetolactate decarboxylase [Defluviicoccus sp.]
MPQQTIDIPASLIAGLDQEARQSGRTRSSVIVEAVARYLNTPIKTVFQVSTSGALVAGVYDREVSVRAILDHGNFGLGTFAGLDGEMVVVDGRAYQVQGSGRVIEASGDAGAPYAVVTWFKPETEASIADVRSFGDLETRCDAYRGSGNIFYAFRLDGHFTKVRTRVVNPPEPGTRLVEAAKAQSEFVFMELDGTLVGLWSPSFSSAFSVPGYHLHFLSADRQHGGHLLDLEADTLELKVEALSDFHLALPETEEFLKADLSKNTAAELAEAEKAH